MIILSILVVLISTRLIWILLRLLFDTLMRFLFLFSDLLHVRWANLYFLDLLLLVFCSDRFQEPLAIFGLLAFTFSGFPHFTLAIWFKIGDIVDHFLQVWIFLLIRYRI